MAHRELVLVDTCIWVQFFNRPHSREKKAVDELLDEDRAAFIGPILAEILLGFRRDDQADWVASLLRGLNFLQVTWDEWRAAARLGRHLMARGNTLPQSDLVIAAVAQQRSLAVYTTDPDFDSLSGLKRFAR